MTGDSGTDQDIELYNMVMPEVAYGLDEQLEREGWDLPPRLFVVSRADAPGVSLVTMVSAPGWEQVLYKVAEVQDNPVQTSLLILRNVYTEQTELLGETFPTLTQNLFGLAMTTEAWVVARPQGGPPLDDDIRPAAHPDRVEVRLTMLVPVLGDPISVLRPRGGDPVLGTDDDTVMGGSVPDLMREIIDALLPYATGTPEA